MSKRRASPGYRDAFNYYNSAVQASGSSTLGSYSLPSSDGDSQELQSDTQVEEDVIQLHCKVQHLVEQVCVLAEDQANTEDNFTRFKQESGTFTAKIVMLEEHIKEIEKRGEEHLQEVQRKNKVLIESMEKEKQLETDNYVIRYTSLEKDHIALVEEMKVLRIKEEMVQQDKKKVEEQLFETQLLLLREQEQHRILQQNMARRVEERVEERKATCLLVQDMDKELNELRLQLEESFQSRKRMAPPDKEVFCDLTGRLVEMETEMKQLKEENLSYRETNQEMEVAILTKGLEEGRHLLNTQGSSHSLSEEFEAMDNNDMRNSLSEQKKVNHQLQRYIDSVLLNIMERYPELLEVANK